MLWTSVRHLCFLISVTALGACQGSSSASHVADAGTTPPGLNDPDSAVNGGKSRADCNKQELAWIALSGTNVSVCAGALTARTRPCCASALKARYAQYASMVDDALSGGYQLYNCEQLATGTTAHFEKTPGDGSRGYLEVTFGDPQPLPGTTLSLDAVSATGTAAATTGLGTAAGLASAGGVTTVGGLATAGTAIGTGTPASAGASATASSTATATATTAATSTSSAAAAAAAAAATAAPGPADTCDVDVNAKYRGTATAATAAATATATTTASSSSTFPPLAPSP